MTPASSSKRLMTLIYGILCYMMFFGVFLYSVGFIGNFLTPTALDGQPRVDLASAALTNVLLLIAFSVQHSGMARPAFKRWWTQFVPQAVERSTYILFSNIAMIAMFIFWQPMGGTVWNIESGVGRTIVYGLFALGCATVFYATCLINHFDLFGLRQVWLYFHGRPYTQLQFRIPSLYRYVRHPLYVGWLTVLWATPTMTAAHLMFAIITTVYIIVATRFEERDLASAIGKPYTDYQQTTPRLIPRIGRSKGRAGAQNVPV